MHISRSLAIAVALSSMLPLSGQVDPVRAEAYFKEAKAFCDRDGGKLWGVSLCGPMVIADPATGTIEIRGVFPNPDRVLLPGLFARIRLPFTRGQATLVPDVAVATDQGGRFVLVVDDHDVVQQRRVRVAALVDEMRVVEEGVTPADWVVVNGLQRARAGVTVKPNRTTAEAAVAATTGRNAQAQAEDDGTGPPSGTPAATPRAEPSAR